MECKIRHPSWKLLESSFIERRYYKSFYDDDQNSIGKKGGSMSGLDHKLKNGSALALTASLMIEEEGQIRMMDLLENLALLVPDMPLVMASVCACLNEKYFDCKNGIVTAGSEMHEALRLAKEMIQKADSEVKVKKAEMH